MEEGDLQADEYLTIRLPFAHIIPVMRLISRLEGKIRDSLYGSQVELQVLIPNRLCTTFFYQFMKIARGQTFRQEGVKH